MARVLFVIDLKVNSPNEKLRSCLEQDFCPFTKKKKKKNEIHRKVKFVLQ